MHHWLALELQRLNIEHPRHTIRKTIDLQLLFNDYSLLPNPSEQERRFRDWNHDQLGNSLQRTHALAHTHTPINTCKHTCTNKYTYVHIQTIRRTHMHVSFFPSLTRFSTTSPWLF